ncbi:MAG: hypothetical protein JKX82_16280 [Oleispira sp.]|nr:hypothetical protein [Oleispira sp.]
MRSSHYLAIAVRIFALMLFIYGLRQMFPVLELFLLGTVNGMEVSPFFVIVTSIIPILFSIVLWLFPLSISASILKPEMDLDVVPLSQGDWLVVLLIGLGLYTLYLAISDSIFWLYLLHISSLSNSSLEMRVEDKANLVISLLEVTVSIFLILKAKTMATFILKTTK